VQAAERAKDGTIVSEGAGWYAIGWLIISTPQQTGIARCVALFHIMASAL
jgi:hypothetical protein